MEEEGDIPIFETVGIRTGAIIIRAWVFLKSKIINSDYWDTMIKNEGKM